MLWEAFACGTWVDLRDRSTPAGSPPDAGVPGKSRVVRAKVIEALLLGAATGGQGQAPGIRLRGAVVQGRLDLMGANIIWPLICEYCSFDSELVFTECSTKTISIVKSALSAFDGTRIALDGILNLQGSVIRGGVRLDQARDGSRVVPLSSAVTYPIDGRRIVVLRAEYRDQELKEQIVPSGTSAGPGRRAGSNRCVASAGCRRDRHRGPRSEAARG